MLYFSQNRRCGIALNGFAYGSVDRKVCPVHVPRLKYNVTLDGSRTCFLTPTRLLLDVRAGDLYVVELVVITGE